MRRVANDGARLLLLDTCACIYLANGEPMTDAALDAIAAAEALLVSPISAWEIGLASRRKRSGVAIFLPDAQSWFDRLLAAPTIRLAPFDGRIAIAFSYLPEPLHGDPADRLLIATARSLAIPLVTRDRLILDYAAHGHVGAVPC